MSNITDPYQILGVSPNATDDEVKKHTESLAANTILMQMPEIHCQTLPKKNLNRFRKHTVR